VTRTDDGHWTRRLARHGPGVVVFAVAALLGGLAGLVAEPVPWWAPSAAFVVASMLIARTYELFWRPTPRDLHVRAAVHTGLLGAVVHLAGWGALLVPLYLLPSSDLHRASGLPVARLPVRWAMGVTVAGQGLVFAGIAPTVVPRGLGAGIAAISMLVVVTAVGRLEDDQHAVAEAAAEAEARAARLRTVLDGSREAVVVARHGIPRELSTRVMNLLGLLDDRHAGDRLLHRVHPQDAATLAMALGAAGAAAGGRRRPPEGRATIRLRHVDESWIEVDATWRDQPGGDETIVHLHELGEVAKLRDELERVSHVDALTGLANRRAVRRRLPQLVGLAQRSEASSAVLMVDLDGFKPVNDRLGHAAGDEVLRDVALDLRTALRAHDTVARVGGDEFVLLLEQLESRQAAHEVAERLTEIIGRTRTAAAATVVVGCSIGLRHVDGSSSIEELLDDADQAMYLAKRSGGGRVVVHDARVPRPLHGPDHRSRHRHGELLVGEDVTGEQV
jgi:diguanylate cyclase (GGDEF)-like protein